MRDEKRQNRIVEFPCANLIEIMTATREDLYFGARDQSGEFLGKITWSNDIVFSTDDKGRGLDARQIARPVECEHGIHPAGDDLDRREGCEVLRLCLTQPLVVAGDP